jgi:hypothetical protein
MFIRVVNALLGLWLFASAFMGSTAPVQFINVLVVSVLVMIFGMASVLGRHGARRINAALGAWLFISALALPHTSTGQTFHNIIVAVLLVITSLFPHVHYHRPRTAA